MTGRELIALWDERDERYLRRRIARQPHPLAEAEIAMIRLARADEIEMLPAPERREPSAILHAWQPPIPALGQPSDHPEAIRSRERRATHWAKVQAIRAARGR